MFIGRILAAIALACALVVTALGVWLGDAWGISIGILAILGATFTTTLVWRTRR